MENDNSNDEGVTASKTTPSCIVLQPTYDAEVEHL